MHTQCSTGHFMIPYRNQGTHELASGTEFRMFLKGINLFFVTKTTASGKTNIMSNKQKKRSEKKIFRKYCIYEDKYSTFEFNFFLGVVVYHCNARFLFKYMSRWIRWRKVKYLIHSINNVIVPSMIKLKCYILICILFYSIHI